MRLIMPMLLGAAFFVSGLVPQTPPDAPAARGGHAMTYDSHHGLALMFGGGSRQQSFNDLWAWNGKRWQRLDESGPSPRDSATFAYDSRRNRAIVVGGRSLGALVDARGNGTARCGANRKCPGLAFVSTTSPPSTRGGSASSSTGD